MLADPNHFGVNALLLLLDNDLNFFSDIMLSFLGAVGKYYACRQA